MPKDESCPVREPSFQGRTVFHFRQKPSPELMERSHGRKRKAASTKKQEPRPPEAIGRGGLVMVLDKRSLRSTDGFCVTSADRKLKLKMFI
ncbi:hypothetical protein V6N13_006298 [Hibiscus sabdariffa]